MNARDYALGELDAASLPGWERQLIRRKVETPTDPRDLGLAEHIRVGVIKNLALLEHLLSHYARRADAIDPIVRKIICIGLYQIRFMDRIPPSAAVNEAVEQARRFGRPHAAGFVNAVLRRAVREPAVPLPSASDNPEKYATIVLSHPPELVRKLFELLGPEKAIQFCEHDNREPPTLVRLNRGMEIDQLGRDDIQLAQHDQPGIVVVEGADKRTLGDWAARGVAQVQDATAAGVVEYLDLKPGQSVLDRCAGMGTKTFQIFDQIGSDGSIMAIDPSESRCAAMLDLIRKRGISNIRVVQASMLEQIHEPVAGGFDRVLVDVPCGNSGVLARRPEARYSQNAAAIQSLSNLQDQILSDTAPYLRPGGKLVYSTCSIWPEENERRAEQFLNSHPEYELVNALLTLPSMDPAPTRYHDGGFLAVLRRR